MPSHIESQVVQSNDFYPFGPNAESFSRLSNIPNKFLYNAGAELNETSGNYETFYRHYDPVLGRFNAIDPLASSMASWTPYHFGFDNPIMYNDPLGDLPLAREKFQRMTSNLDRGYGRRGGGGRGLHNRVLGQDLVKLTKGIASDMQKAQAEKDKEESNENSSVTVEAIIDTAIGVLKDPNASNSTELAVINNEIYTFQWLDNVTIQDSKLDQDENGATFYTNDTEAYNALWNNSFDEDRKPWRENSGFIVKGGIIVLPTEGFAYEGRKKTNKWRINRVNISANDYIPFEIIDGKRHVIFGGKSYQVLAQIHTHPSGMSQKPYIGDAEALKDLKINRVYTIGTNMVGYGDLKENKRGVIGTQEGLLNGDYFLER